MKINKGDILYFLGIGGIGMSALARWCHSLGAQIYGYDLQQTRLTMELEDEGMKIHYEIDVDQIPEKVVFAIYTPAVPQDNDELAFFYNSTIPLFKRSQFLGDISRDYFTIAIAGTHGKTSISALTAHLLKHADKNVSAFVGGICRNYNTNLILSDKTELLVIEADEFDRSLLRLKPDIAVISSIDSDHLDIYSDHNDIVSTFIEFGKGIKHNGTLIYHSDTGPFDSLNCNKMNYSTKHQASAMAKSIRIKDGSYIIDIEIRDLLIRDIKINVPGLHNIENALAASSIAYLVGLTGDEIKLGLESFIGVERRMDYRILGDMVYIDDYAHHPEEIKNTVETVKQLYPGKRLTGIFQPHLYSRTKDFLKEFSQELSKLDEVILLDIYPAREKPIPGITSELLSDMITDIPCKVLSKKEMLSHLSFNKPEVLLTMGAGDIGFLVEEIEKILTE